MKKSCLLLIVALLSACSGALRQPISEFVMQTPRPFGYFIGDEIKHRLIVEVRSGLLLKEESLPTVGELNRWLQLKRIDKHKTADGWVIELVYQVFYAPREVKMLSIPGFKLQFSQGGQTIEQAVAAWNFTLSPLKELAVRKDEGHDYMRPDAVPEPLSSDAIGTRLYTSLSLTIGVAGYLAFLYGYFPAWPRRRIFKQACRQLQRLDERDTEQGLAVLHMALNSLHRRPLFKHQLADFYQNHPEYRMLAAELNGFFEYSNQVFFAGQRDYRAEDWRKLTQLCQQCREIERGSR